MKGSIGRRLDAALLAVLLGAAGCTTKLEIPAPPGTQAADVDSSVRSARPIRDPSDLPMLPEEARLVAALASVGLQADHVGVSKFEDLFHGRPPARVFGSKLSEPAWRVDVVWLDSATDLRVCPSTGRAYEYTIYYNGRFAGMGSTRDVFFAAGDHLLVMASELRAREALRTEFALRVPAC